MQADIPDALKSKTYGALLEALLLENDLLPLGLYRLDTDGRLVFFLPFRYFPHFLFFAQGS